MLSSDVKYKWDLLFSIESDEGFSLCAVIRINKNNKSRKSFDNLTNVELNYNEVTGYKLSVKSGVHESDDIILKEDISNKKEDYIRRI